MYVWHGSKEKVGQLLCQAFEDTDPPVLEIAEILILSSTSTLSTYMWDPEDLLTPSHPFPRLKSTPADTGTMLFKTYVRDANPKASPIHFRESRFQSNSNPWATLLKILSLRLWRRSREPESFASWFCGPRGTELSSKGGLCRRRPSPFPYHKLLLTLCYCRGASPASQQTALYLSWKARQTLIAICGLLKPQGAVTFRLLS